MIEIADIAVSLLPVFIFLAILIFLDSFKLVKFRFILITITIGCLVALTSMLFNWGVLSLLPVNPLVFSHYISPLIEESLKAIFPIYLLKSKKIGFMVDGAIFGFAVGAGFALIENIYYFSALHDQNIYLWIIRGFGTAVMHGGTTAVLTILSKYLSERSKNEKIFIFVPGLIIAYMIHSFFNHFFFPPFITTLLQITSLPLIMIFIFSQSEKGLREWLETGFDTDMKLLEYIKSGNIKQTKVGEYLYSLKGQFPGEIVVDMLNYLRLHLELAVRAKGILLMQEAGFDAPVDPEIMATFQELKYLEKSIGKTGKLAIAPLIHTSSKDLWQLHMLKTE